jgi:hypothetical protein
VNRGRGTSRNCVRLLMMGTLCSRIGSIVLVNCVCEWIKGIGTRLVLIDGEGFIHFVSLIQPKGGVSACPAVQSYRKGKEDYVFVSARLGSRLSAMCCA